MIGPDTAAAVGIVQSNGIATLILPADVAWSQSITSNSSTIALRPTRPESDSAVIVGAARELRENARRCALLLGGKSLNDEQLELAAQISSATGALLLSDTFVPKTQRGGGRSSTKVPYPIRNSTSLFADLGAVMSIDTKAPVSFFAYPEQSSVLTQPGTRI